MPKIDNPMDRVELYKLRLEESRYRYESMRSLEWRVLLQTYAGYAAISVAFSRLDHPEHPEPFLRYLAAIAMAFLFASTSYLYFRIQERMTGFSDAHLKNMNRIDELLEEENPLIANIARLRHKHFWTYDTQLVLGTFTLIVLLTYIFMPGLAAHDNGDLAFVSIVAGGAIFLSAVLRYRGSKWNSERKAETDQKD